MVNLSRIQVCVYMQEEARKKYIKRRKSWWKTFVVTLKSNQKKKIRCDIESDMLTDLFICFGYLF